MFKPIFSEDEDRLIALYKTASPRFFCAFRPITMVRDPKWGHEEKCWGRENLIYILTLKNTLVSIYS